MKYYEEVLRKHKDIQTQIEDYVMKYEEKEEEKLNLIKSSHKMKEGTNSEFSEYADAERSEISRILLNSVITTLLEKI